MNEKRLVTLVMACVLALGLLPTLMAARADRLANTYTLTIPAELTVAQPGWNALEGGITARGNLAEYHKLTVTASSEYGWKLKASSSETDNLVGYNLVSSSDTAYASGAEPASWVFETLSDTADTTLTAGVVVEDYTGKNLPVGQYEDTVTFRAALEIEYLTLTVPFNGSNNSLTFEYLPGQTWGDMTNKYPEIIKENNGICTKDGDYSLVYLDEVSSSDVPVSEDDPIDSTKNYKLIEALN